MNSMKSRDLKDINPKNKRIIHIRNLKLAYQTPVIAKIEINIKDPFYKILKKKLDKLSSYDYTEV